MHARKLSVYAYVRVQEKNHTKPNLWPPYTTTAALKPPQIRVSSLVIC